MPNDGVTRGLDALVTELKRVATFGFTATELDRAKQANLAGSERVVEESPDRESSSRADEYTRNFLQREALPTIWQELAFHRRFLPEITLSEMNALAADWFPEANRLVIVVDAGSGGTGAALRVAAGRGGRSRLGQERDRIRRRRRRADVDGTSAGQREHRQDRRQGRRDRVEAVEWRHGGAAADDVEGGSDPVHGQAPGGTSLASDADFFAARVADDVIPAGGVGTFSEVVLDKLLDGESLAVQPFISEIREGMRGGSAPRDLEAMFQLMYLRFTAPRADPTVFAGMKARRSRCWPINRRARTSSSTRRSPRR